MKYTKSGRVVMNNNGVVIIKEVSNLHNNTSVGLILSDLLNKYYMNESVIHINISSKSKRREFKASGVLFRDKIYKNEYGYCIYNTEAHKNNNYDSSSRKCIDEVLLDCVGHNIKLTIEVEVEKSMSEGCV